MKENSGKGALGERTKNLGRGNIGCRRQSSLAADSLQSNSSFGERINDESIISLNCNKEKMYVPAPFNGKLISGLSW